MDFCSKKILSAVYTEDERADLAVDTNIISVTCSDIPDKQNLLNPTPPIPCNSCQAYLSSISTVYEPDEYRAFVSNLPPQNPDEEHKVDPSKPILKAHDVIPFKDLSSNKKIWICDYCGKHNLLPVDFTSPPKQNDCFFGKSKEATENEENVEIEFKKNTEQDQRIIFCLDNSGSMGGTNLRCVQNAVTTQIKDIHTKYPKKKIGLVTFESRVRLLGDCKSAQMTLPSGDHGNYDQCLHFGQTHSQNSLAHPVEESLEKLLKEVKNIEAMGSTALGPALLVSLGLVMDSNPGTMVIVCTDGMANEGVGSMGGKGADEFYRKVGTFAKEKGIIISVLTIRGGECKVDKLALLSDMTGGMVSRLKPTRIGKDFGKALEGNMIGTDASFRVQLHRALCFKNEEEHFVLNDQDLTKHNSIYVKDLGNITVSTELTLEYRFKSKGDLAKMGIKLENLGEVPVQCQLKYTNLEGRDVLRVMTLNLKVSKSESEVKKSANVKIVAMRAAHDVAREADQGNFVSARKLFKKWDRFLEDQLLHLNKDNADFQKYYSIVKTKNEVLEKQLNKNIARKIKKKDAKVQKDINNLSDDGQKNLLKSLDANSSDGSSDDCCTKVKRFCKKRQASYECLSAASDDDGKLNINQSDSDSNPSIKVAKKSAKKKDFSSSDSDSEPQTKNKPRKRKTSARRNSSSSSEDTTKRAQKKNSSGSSGSHSDDTPIGMRANKKKGKIGSENLDSD